MKILLSFEQRIWSWSSHVPLWKTHTHTHCSKGYPDMHQNINNKEQQRNTKGANDISCICITSREKHSDSWSDVNNELTFGWSFLKKSILKLVKGMLWRGFLWSGKCRDVCNSIEFNITLMLGKETKAALKLSERKRFYFRNIHIGDFKKTGLICGSIWQKWFVFCIF